MSLSEKADAIYVRLPTEVYRLGGTAKITGYQPYMNNGAGGTSTFSAKYDLGNGYTASQASVNEYNFGNGNITITATAPSGYYFQNWTDGDGTYSSNPYTYKNSGANYRSRCFTANFRKGTYTITYNANGGSCQTDKDTGAVDESVSLPSASRTGYNFDGWYTQASGGTFVGTSGDEVYPTSNQTVYAHWSLVPAHKVQFLTSPEGVGSPATITTDPIRVVSGVDYYSDSDDVTIKPFSISGYELVSIVYYDATNPNQSVVIGSKTVTNGDLSPFKLSSSDRNGRDIVLRFNYERISYSQNAFVHDSSTGKVSVSVSSDTAYLGDTVTFEATDVASGCSFAGWYDADGVLVNEEATYVHEVTGNTSLYAKCCVSCSLSISYPNGTAGENETCRLEINGAEYERGTHFDVVLGDSFSYLLILGTRTETENWVLDLWTIGNELSFIPIQGTLSPEGSFDLVAHVSSVSQATKTLTINTAEFDMDENDILVMENVAIAPDANNQPVNPYTFEGGISPPHNMHGVVRLRASEQTPGQFSESFSGVQYVRVTAMSNVFLEDNAEKSFFRGFYDETGALISQELSIVILLSTSRTLWVAYGEASGVRIQVAYVDSENPGGFCNIVSTTADDSESFISNDGMSAVVMQGESVTLLAVANNGFAFKGWYDSSFSAGDELSTEERYEFKVTAETIVYAVFVQARDSICAWEGSSKNKKIEWTSKTYVAQRPFDPVAARVDSAAYPVTLDVGTMSSPDAEPTRSHLVRVQGQGGRRLQRMRPERFVRFTVSAASEIDAVVIGTNMSEVN